MLLCGCDSSWNDPYPKYNVHENTLYTAFTERPKHLDPALSYSENEAALICQIYESPLQYNYLKRPYTLEPLLASDMPSVRYFNEVNQEVSSSAKDIAYSVFSITIKPNVYYQKHPAFTKLYNHLTLAQVKNKHTIEDFPKTATRELVAEDFVYQIKRLGDPHLNSPIFGVMEKYIVGLKEFAETIKTNKNIDLRSVPLEGAKSISKYTYEIKIRGKYPQFLYWLAMPFFVPMPWEAIEFYNQRLLQVRNISLDWYPVGTGPFLLKENNPNSRMVMVKNSMFRGEKYPINDEKELRALSDKPIPFLDKIIFTLEKESIPYWSKFLQGYYDQANVISDNFDQALKTVGGDSVELTPQLKQMGVKLSTTVAPSVFFWGFNMYDKTVGGYTEKQKMLRQAIALAVDMQEYINIFANGNAVVAKSPIPPGIFGFQEDSAKSGNIEQARELLSQAGYPNGVDAKNKHPLVLYYDAIMSSSAQGQAQFSWMRKQFKKLGIELVIRATQYNRFQDKMRSGEVQLYGWGWNADYPDPENFLFLLYGPNGLVKFDGENMSNYQNVDFDNYFEQMKRMENSPERQAIISKMLEILKEDMPWFAGFNPKNYTLRQAWMGPIKTNAMSRNTMKYVTLNPELREKLQIEWNRPNVWPLFIIILVFILLCIPAVLLYWQKIHRPLKLEKVKN